MNDIERKELVGIIAEANMRSRRSGFIIEVIKMSIATAFGFAIVFFVAFCYNGVSDYNAKKMLIGEISLLKEQIVTMDRKVDQRTEMLRKEYTKAIDLSIKGTLDEFAGLFKFKETGEIMEEPRNVRINPDAVRNKVRNDIDIYQMEQMKVHKFNIGDRNEN